MSVGQSRTSLRVRSRPALPGTFLTRYLSKKVVKTLLETQGRSRPCGLFGTLVSLSFAYIFMANPHCRRLLVHWMRKALDFAPASAGNNNAARIAMMAITTSNSMRVKAGEATFLDFIGVQRPVRGPNPDG